MKSILFVLAFMFAFMSTESTIAVTNNNGPIVLIEPTTLVDLPQIVPIQISLNTSVINTKNLTLHAYQRGIREKEGTWHCVKVNKISDDNYIGEVWLGSKELGKNETFLLKIILSDKKVPCNDGSKQLDEAKDLPSAIHEKVFILKRGNK
jgi:hypothetical protein